MDVNAGMGDVVLPEVSIKWAFTCYVFEVLW